MHELGIASSILDAVRDEAEKHPSGRVTKVGVRIGVLSGVEPEALSFGFNALIQGTDLDPLTLAIEFVPRRQRFRRVISRSTCSKTIWHARAARTRKQHWRAARNSTWPILKWRNDGTRFGGEESSYRERPYRRATADELSRA